MALTKQEVIRQIQQGKVQSALEGMVQLSGLARDKEVQQRCVLLQSQLSQLNAKFGMGTFDNKTYQLELNRITQAALEIAYDMPTVVQAPPQYARPQYSPVNQHSSSAWKTWGILLTGAVGVVVILAVINLSGNSSPDQATNAQTSFLNPESTSQIQPTKNQDVRNPDPGTSRPQPVEQPASRPQDKFAGIWQGVVSVSDIPMATLFINLQTNGRYESQLTNAYTNEMLSKSLGTWSLQNDGLLNLTSQDGEKETYSVEWVNNVAFNAVLIKASDASLIGMKVAFVKNN